MPADITRTSDDLRQGYRAPILQQGRVILDRDFNALHETLRGELGSETLDIIGPCGTPDNGFAISVSENSSPSNLWQPPAPLTLGAPRVGDFLIGPGTMYVGGQRAVFPPPWNYSYFDQPDWAYPTDPLGGGSPSSLPGLEFVYLRLFEQEVSAVEDFDLKDVALGGPDTTQRLRLMRRVERLPASSPDCGPALDQAKDTWLASGFGLDPATLRLQPQARLLVTLDQTNAAANPCDPVAQGGYLRAENQLIRVRISDSGQGGNGKPKLIWGYDNASCLYRVTTTDGLSLQLQQLPVDAFHTPQAGQVVEVLRTAAVIGSEKDVTDPSAQAVIVRCVAEALGEIRTLTAPYDSATGDVVLDSALPPDFLNDKTPLFLRIWQAQLDFTLGVSVPLTSSGAPGSPGTSISTGLQVTISLDQNNFTPPVGAYWMIAARPNTPQTVYPERFLSIPQPPDGPRQWVCALGVIDWSRAGFSPSGEPEVTPCQNNFTNLTTRTEIDELVSQVFDFAAYGQELVLNEGDILNASDLAHGLRILFTRDIVPASASPAACFVTLDLPFAAQGQILGAQPVVLSANIVAESTKSLLWNPFPGVSDFLANRLSLDGPVTFASEWELAPPGKAWQYVNGAAAVPWDELADVHFLAINNSSVRQGASRLRFSVELPSAGESDAFFSVAVIFNYLNSNDFWVFQFSSSCHPSGTGSFNCGSGIGVLHIQNGLVTQSATGPSLPFLSPASVDFEVARAMNSQLSFTASLVSAGQTTPQVFQIPFPAAPAAFATGSRLGVVSQWPGSAHFTRLLLDYDDGSTQTFLPAKLLARLTIKRNAIRFAGANENSTASRPDFSRSFWVIPGSPSYGYGASALGVTLL